MAKSKRESAARRLASIERQLDTQQLWLAQLRQRYETVRDRVVALETERDEIMETWFPDGVMHQ